MSLLRGKILEYKVRAVRAFTINTSVITPLLHNEKNILKIVDMMGQESAKRTNTIQLYIFDDGSVEKKIILQ